MAFERAEGFLKDNKPQQPIVFHPSPKPTLGVEVELYIVDPETGEMAPKFSQLAAALGPDAASWAKCELFQGLIEVISKKCDTVEDARTDMEQKFRRLFAAADKCGLAVIGGGTHPLSKWFDQPITDNERYHRLTARMGWPGRQMMTAGTHVHVGVDSGEKAIAILNSLSCYYPHLLALSAASPYWVGYDTNLACMRLKVFELLPTAGLPPRMTNWNEFVHLMRTLINADAITSIREIWWDARPHLGLGTLEVRIMDNLSSPSELMAMAALVQSLIVYLADLYDNGSGMPHLSNWVIRENKWRAIRWAEEAEFIRNDSGDLIPLAEHIRETLAELRPYAERLGCHQYFPVIEAMLSEGPSYRRSRAHMAANGNDFKKLVNRLAEDYRRDAPFGHLAKEAPPFYSGG